MTGKQVKAMSEVRDRITGDRVYKGIIIDVDVDEVLLPNGVTAKLEIIRHPGAATVVPVWPDGSVTMVRQYRYAAGGFIYEVPAGKFDPGDTPESCVLREVEEEAGVRAARIHDMGFIFTTPGFTDEKIHMFAATHLTETQQNLEHDEVLELERMSMERALKMAETGEIHDGKTLCTLFRLQQELAAGRIDLG